MAKYGYEGTKSDCGWARIVSGLNGKGRGYKSRKAFALIKKKFHLNRNPTQKEPKSLPRSATTVSF